MQSSALDSRSLRAALRSVYVAASPCRSILLARQLIAFGDRFESSSIFGSSLWFNPSLATRPKGSLNSEVRISKFRQFFLLHSTF
jgi:hypothetical protein